MFSLLVLLAGLATTMAQAQTAPASLVQGTTKPAAAGKTVAPVSIQKSEAKPLWQELTPAQQQALKPLSANWPSIGEAQKRKWLAVSKNYPTLSSAEQQKMHGRMTEWVSLSADQRTQARLNFAETKKLSPGEKTANWEAYQALSPEEKQKLAAKAASKPVGAAAAVKPVAPQKLAAVPVTRNAPKGSPQIASSTHTVDQNTLLPRPKAAPETAVVKRN
jgi:hypothetical protein